MFLRKTISKRQNLVIQQLNVDTVDHIYSHVNQGTHPHVITHPLNIILLSGGLPQDFWWPVYFILGTN